MKSTFTNMKKILTLLFLFPLFLFSQTQLTGIVIDSKTKKPLPFATVLTNTHFGTLADVDGKFEIKTKNPFQKITISYVGYHPTTIPISAKENFVKVRLKTSVESLQEILITAKENPALRIVRNAIANKSKNNIEKALNSFKFNSYNKLLITANPDSINGKIDSVFTLKKGVKKFTKIDSSNYEFKKSILKQHLFISEKISEFQFKKGKKRRETILASRMAGLKQPLYELLAVSIQDFSFYNESYTVLGTKYINPLAKNALKHYRYKILDTVNNAKGQAFLIYYKPKVKTATIGIEGVLYLDTQTFAITKAIAELKGTINVKATQNFTYIKEAAIWFPKNKNILIKRGKNKGKMNLFGGLVKVSTGRDTKNDSLVHTRKKDPSNVLYFISKHNHSNIEINKIVNVKSSSANIEFSDNVHKKPENFWNKYRTEKISSRGKRTYVFLDSIVAKEGVEKKIDLARNLLKGFYPTKYILLDIGKIANFNAYEGLRIGFGGVTNSNFSNTYKINSYIAYGTKDSNFKYRLGVSKRVHKNSNSWLGFNYTNEIKEAASLDFINKNTSFLLNNPRNFNLSKFYNYKTSNLFLLHDLQPNLESKLLLSAGKHTPLFNYQYVGENKNLNAYHLTTATLALQYNPNSEYMNAPVGKLTIKNNYPQFTLQVAKSFDNILNGDFNFTQVNFRTLYKVKQLQRVSTSFMLEGGIVFGNAPISHLYNASPNHSLKNPWIKRLTFAGKNSFETMEFNEFISDKYAALHIKHYFKPFKIGKSFRPRISLISRVAFGTIKNPQYHQNISFKNLSKGYFESGMAIKNIYKGFGLKTFYRYGKYQHSAWSNNLAIKLSYSLQFGF